MVRFRSQLWVTGLKKLSFTLLLASLLMASAATLAARVEHLFEAQVAVAGRDGPARDAALADALQEVLVRLTGDRSVLQSPAAAGLLEEPGRFVEQYRFVDSGAAGLALWAQFDGVSLARELRLAGLPYWGEERPDVLVWLAVDDRGQRYVAGETDPRPVNTSLRQLGQRYGLPLTLPLMDLEDQRQVDFTDIWGNFFARIQTASQRYRAQAILTVRVERSSVGDWRAGWQLIDGGSQQAWSSHGESVEAALAAGLADATQWLAQRYALVATTAGSRSLLVEDVRNLDDYARAAAYLASLSSVDRLDVVRVEGHSVAFSLGLNADERSLRRLISLGRTLHPVDDPLTWRFRLQP